MKRTEKKREPTCERLREWIGVNDSHTQFLVEGNPNPGFENLGVSDLGRLLSKGGLLRVGNRYTMRIYCRKWNDIVRKLDPSLHKSMLLHPAKAEFSLTIPYDGRSRR